MEAELNNKDLIHCMNDVRLIQDSQQQSIYTLAANTRDIETIWCTHLSPCMFCHREVYDWLIPTM